MDVSLHRAENLLGGAVGDKASGADGMSDGWDGVIVHGGVSWRG